MVVFQLILKLLPNIAKCNKFNAFWKIIHFFSGAIPLNTKKKIKNQNQKYIKW